MNMGGRSIAGRAANEKQRTKLAQSGIMKNFFEDKAVLERNPPTKEEVKCQHCGFKARYKFHRCPECDKVQEEKKE